MMEALSGRFIEFASYAASGVPGTTIARLKRRSTGSMTLSFSNWEPDGRTLTMGGKDKCQCFVSMGIVQPGLPYAFDMGGGFVPFRRDVVYVPAQEAPIAPLLDRLAFVEDRSRWGYKFRFGLFKVNDHDMALIAQAMQTDMATLGLTAVMM